jgi:hypothetical protein
MANFRMKQRHYDAVLEYIWLKFGCKPSDIPRQFLEEAHNGVLSEELRHLAWIMNQPIVVTLDFSEPIDWLLGEHGYTIYSIRLARRLNSD